MDFTPQRLLEILIRLSARIPQGASARWWIAYSGGMDSHVLLDALHAVQPQLPGVRLQAVHVDHGLQAASARWTEHCECQCRALGIPLHTVRANAAPRPGESPEAAARRVRYAALAGCMAPGDVIITAHHQNDQAETLLLQLLRGGGPRGQAAMPANARFAHGFLWRPLLEFEREALRVYGLAQGLEWIEDVSNLDVSLDRNFLRHEIIPRLLERWPAAVRNMGRAAHHNAEAAGLLEVLADRDLEQVRGDRPGTLSVEALRSLDPPRRRNALRRWISRRGLRLPAARKLQHVLRDVLEAAPDQKPRVAWPGAELRRYRDMLCLLPPLPPAPEDVRYRWDLRRPVALLTPPGVLRAVPAEGRGLSLQRCTGLAVTVRFRRGGERCRPAGREHHHALKKLFQEAGIPPWGRERMPLVYVGETLAVVPGLCVCHPFEARSGEAGLTIEWRPEQPNREPSSLAPAL